MLKTENKKNGCVLFAVIGMIGGGFSAAVKSGSKAGSKRIKPPATAKPFSRDKSRLQNIPFDDVVQPHDNDRKKR